jgi:hypothetical protein
MYYMPLFSSPSLAPAGEEVPFFRFSWWGWYVGCQKDMNIYNFGKARIPSKY